MTTGKILEDTLILSAADLDTSMTPARIAPGSHTDHMISIADTFVFEDSASADIAQPLILRPTDRAA